jgi:chromate reductase
MGGFGASQHLRQCLVFLDMPTLQQPEAYVGGVDKLFTADGDYAQPATKQFLIGFLNTFERWIRKQTSTT